MSNIKLKHHLTRAWVMLLTLLASFLINQTCIAGNYLLELEEEAASLDNAKSEQDSATTGKPEWTNQQAGTLERFKSGLSKAQFEESLKSHFYGSYLFYSALDAKKQQHVYEEYQDNNDIEHLRKSIKNQMTK